MKILPLRLLSVMVLALIALSGCVTVPVAKDGEKLQPNQGLLAFHVSSNADVGLSYLDYESSSTFGSRFGENMYGPKGQFRFKAGQSYHVVPMDAGEYMFSKFTVGTRFSWMQGTNRFKVSANTITYIGHIDVKVADNRYNTKVFDRELEMRTHLADAYPNYFKSMNLVKSYVELSLKPQAPKAVE